MMGVKGEQLDNLAASEAEWEIWLTKFRDYHDIWSASGFIRMFRQFIARERILIRLMSLSDGERRNTNILHLTELLHQASVEKKLGTAWLIKWLAEQRNPNTPRLEENQLRLESDENAVKIVTIHKSKGLEYPIVFCPFMYGHSEIGENTFLFHDETNNRRLTLDLGSEEIGEHKKAAKREELAENLRLLYVALTRAKNRCYLVWGRFNKAGSSAPAYLFHHPGAAEDIVSTAIEKFNGLTDSDIFQALEAVRDKSGGTVGLSEMPDKPGPSYSAPPDEAENLMVRNFSGKIDHQFRVSSFSALTSGQSHSAETGDYDPQAVHYEAPEPEDSAESREHVQDIFSFPKGARAGKCLHEIFEHLDFTEKDVSLTTALVEKKLEAYDFDLTWQAPVCDMIRKTLSVNLDGGELTLSRIRNENRLNELEFYFPLNEISSSILKGIFAEYAGPELPENFPEYIGRLAFSPVRGFMKGFIDMAFQFQGKFYLVDWKSNFLGFSTADYHQGALANAMNENFYILQYHIYTMALHQYLSVRIRDYSYESHFGGVYYIFLRGTDPKYPEFGIYRDRPPEILITKLCEKINSSVSRSL
jgi:exodeoxyribonuclease V beta subunit